MRKHSSRLIFSFILPKVYTHSYFCSHTLNCSIQGAAHHAGSRLFVEPGQGVECAAMPLFFIGAGRDETPHRVSITFFPLGTYETSTLQGTQKNYGVFFVLLYHNHRVNKKLDPLPPTSVVQKNDFICVRFYFFDFPSCRFNHFNNLY